MSSNYGGESSSSTNVPPEDQQRRATLIYMQDEVSFLLKSGGKVGLISFISFVV